MENDLKALVEALVQGDAPAQLTIPVTTNLEVSESDSEEAWNDFQDSQLAFEKAFQDSKMGSL